MNYSQSGNYIAIAGTVVLILNHFGIKVVQTDVEAVIASIVILWGVAKQFRAHKELAHAAGAIPR